MDHEDEVVDWSLLSGDDDMEHQEDALMAVSEEPTEDVVGVSFWPGNNVPRPGEWLKDGISRWALSNQTIRHTEENIQAGGREETAGWLSEETILAGGTCKKEDLTDLVRRGMLETVVEGHQRLYRRVNN